MNLINEIVFEVKKEEKSLRFHAPAGTTYQECYDALVEFMKKILDMSKPQEEQAQTEASETTTQS